MINRKRTYIPAFFAALAFALPAVAISPLLKEFEDAFIRLGAEVRPCVVEIASEGIAPGDEKGMLDELFRFFGNPGPNERGPRRRRAPQSTGSGFVYDTLGHIITNSHVVENAKKLTVKLWDGTKREAILIGKDPSADIAVVKIDPTGLDLVVAKIGHSGDLKVGQFAIAMGSPRGLSGSLSFGHISALGRERLSLPDPNLRFQNFIQTDAAINLGNSGGPLCNIDGEVIGVNIAIVFGANSIGFAIPIDRVREIVPQLIATGKVVRGWLGVAIIDVEAAAQREEQELEDYLDAFGLPDGRGAYVHDVTPDGPAEASGLQSEDVIRKIDGLVVENTIDLINRISATQPGIKVTLEVWREGEAQDISVTLDEFPDMPTARYGRALLGMRVVELSDGIRQRLGLDDDLQGVVVAQVVPGSAAAEADVRAGDVVTKVAHKQVDDIDRFKGLLEDNAVAGKTLLLRVIRGNDEPDSKFIKVPEDFVLP